MRPWRHTAEIIAHRGASAVAPENTLAAVDLAWQWFSDAVEIDVQLTKDRRVVVMHDDSLLRTAGHDLRVADLTFAELREFEVGIWKDSRWINELVPSLADVIASIPENRRLYVELKCGFEILDALVPVLSLVSHMPQSVVLIGLDPELMPAAKQRFPTHRVLQVVEQTSQAKGDWTPSASEVIAHCLKHGLDGADLSNTAAITPELVAEFKAAQLGTCIWTVNTVEDARRLIAAGVDGITTDYPVLLDKPRRRD